MKGNMKLLQDLKRVMLARYPRFGAQIASVGLEFNENLKYHTAATDGKKIYFDPQYLESLNDEERLFITAHELMHIKFEHMFRMTDKKGKLRDLDVWNIATDAIINANLERDGFKIKEGYVNMPDALYYSSEQLYEMLLQEKKQQEQSNQGDQGQPDKSDQSNSDQSQNGQGGSQNNDQDQSEQDDSKNGEQNQSGQENSQDEGQNKKESSQDGNGQSQDDKNGDSQSSQGQSGDENADNQSSEQAGNSSSYLDDHSLWEKAFEEMKQGESKKKGQKEGESQEEKDKDEDSQSTSKQDKKGNSSESGSEKGDKTEPIKDSFDFEIADVDERREFEENREYRRELAKKNIERKREQELKKTESGNIEFGEVGKAKPILDWKLLLRREVEKSETIWSQRRSIAENNYAYRLEENDVEDEAETEVMIDVSGSVSLEMVKAFLRQLKPILKESKLRVGCFNARYWGMVEIKSERDIDKFTIPMAARDSSYAWTEDWDLAVRSFSKKREVNKIVFTDGEPWPGTMPKEDLRGINVLWLVYSNRSFNPCCGKVIDIYPKDLQKMVNAVYEDEDELSM